MFKGGHLRHLSQWLSKSIPFQDKNHIFYSIIGYSWRPPPEYSLSHVGLTDSSSFLFSSCNWNWLVHLTHNLQNYQIQKMINDCYTWKWLYVILIICKSKSTLSNKNDLLSFLTFHPTFEPVTGLNSVPIWHNKYLLKAPVFNSPCPKCLHLTSSTKLELYKIKLVKLMILWAP